MNVIELRKEDLIIELELIIKDLFKQCETENKVNILEKELQKIIKDKTIERELDIQ